MRRVRQVMDNEKLLMAIVSVLARKQILCDSFVVEERPPSMIQGGDDDGFWHRTFSLTFTEILRDADFKKANEQKGRFQTVYEQIRDEYNRLTAYDFEMKETDEGVEVKTDWLE